MLRAHKNSHGSCRWAVKIRPVYRLPNTVNIFLPRGILELWGLRSGSSIRLGRIFPGSGRSPDRSPKMGRHTPSTVGVSGAGTVEAAGVAGGAARGGVVEGGEAFAGEGGGHGLIAGGVAAGAEEGFVIVVGGGALEGLIFCVRL